MSRMRAPWSEEEDARLRDLVQTYGQKWQKISTIIKMREAKQCRERWSNHLRPDIDKSPLKEYEKHKIRILQRKFGCKWTEIAAQIPGRTGLMVKNYWYNEEKRAKHQMRNKMAISRLLLSPNEIEEQ
ncbi:7147_t:CDS:2, partial [Paraglomus occultum]